MSFTRTFNMQYAIMGNILNHIFSCLKVKKLLLQFKNYEEKKYNNESIDYPISKYSLD
jgi:hypothetical protein